MNLVVIPFHDWKKCEREGFRTRDAHLMQEFARHPLVDKLLVIDRPISLSEIILLRRSWCVKHGRRLARHAGACLSQVGDKTFALDLLVPEIVRPVLMRRHWTPYIFGRCQVAEAVRRSLRELGMQDAYALFISAPLFVPLVQQLSPRVFVLDAQDNLLKHALYRDVCNLERYYDFCQEQADLIFANSSETTRWLAHKRPDARWVPNGVDARVFTPTRAYALPPDMAAIPRPIVGYAGKMQEMFDVDLVERLVSGLPQVSFVFIGQQLDPGWVRPVWKYPNAYYLGDKPYHLLAHYLAAFDVCIIPYNLERQHGVDPIKFYEYLAMGKPVVTTDVGGVRAFEDYPQVRIARANDEFVQAVAFFARDIQAEQLVPAKPLPAECLWETKADVMLRSIHQLMNR